MTAIGRRLATLDGNEACADVAYRMNEICAIYPITPSSTMAELADQWAAEGRPNLFGNVPDVIEMQSEAGAAGVLHGALQTGALTTTFTASQGLLLMIPNLYKIAGELTPAVIHVAARALASHALSIFGDHQDVMAARSTGFALLASASVQEAHDMAAVAQASTLESRVPFLHFFDGFRTSHEMQKIELLSDEDLRALVPDAHVLLHRGRALDPDHPFVRGTAQNPDVYFQSREAANPFYAALPAIVDSVLERLADRTGRRYRLFEYHGAPDAERIVVGMGSGMEAAREAVDALVARGERVGVLGVRLFRPFSVSHLLEAIPPTVRAVAVLDRTKEAGASGEPLYLEVVAAFAARGGELPRLAGGRYGLASKEFTPAMVKAVLDGLAEPAMRNPFTVGIVDDVSGTSLTVDPGFVTEPADGHRALFFGLGSDGTVGATKNTIKILADDPGIFAQGYFVYDSKKSGSQTVSHLRFGHSPIRSSYLIREAHFVGCHQFAMIERHDVLGSAADGATVLLNSPYGPDEVFDRLSRRAQEEILAKKLRLHVIDAARVAREAGIAGRINTVLQTCFFAISGVLPREAALEKIKDSIRKTYGRKGGRVVEENFAAVDTTLANLREVPLPPRPTRTDERTRLVPDDAPDFVRRVTATLLEGRGDELPVSALPVDGTFPSGTARFEKRGIAAFVPAWDPDLCIQCGNCAFVCPHAVIRAKLFHESRLGEAPAGFRSAPIETRGFPETRYALQVYPDDCTGCALCVEVCPAKSPRETKRRALHMTAREEILDSARASVSFFETLSPTPRSRVDFSTVRGTQFLEPLFEFSGACAGCGETPYVKLVSQLFGDRLIVANATGCSSIYGGNLPTTPWTKDAEGRGPAWSNSLFEDAAEFGLGMRAAAEHHERHALARVRALRERIGADLADPLVASPQRSEAEIRDQRERVAELRRRLREDASPEAAQLLSIAHHLVRRSVWVMGGDGWAYDIGSGGVDHVLASGRDVNLLVLDTEVYSNTGGQASKATPLGAVAKFASGGKRVERKDLALHAIAYGHVYVARVAMGANPQQTLLALREAEAHPGPSLVLAYSHCIAHGINMQYGLDQQQRAVRTGYWPLMRWNPGLFAIGENPLSLDSGAPTLRLREFTDRELRFRLLARTDPETAERLLAQAEKSNALRVWLYRQMAAQHLKE
ncbi:pyruvate-ferredoxin/flavodoxin oxidoreductase [Myxococcaceae bacterium]|jgi:pyruvate-ferredoxin/flavodoxin oxidoreductase|nr:pyruvate-ferredoxin/flavodoxin oxidoreductase [Myxococcaceae bacterium]